MRNVIRVMGAVVLCATAVAPAAAEMSDEEIVQYLVAHSPANCTAASKPGSPGQYVSASYVQTYTGKGKKIDVVVSDFKYLTTPPRDAKSGDGKMQWSEIKKGTLSYSAPTGFDTELRLVPEENVLKGESKRFFSGFGTVASLVECKLTK